MTINEQAYHLGQFDFLAGPLVCKNCNKLTVDTERSNVQTQANLDPKGSVLEVGDKYEGFPDPFLATGYFHFSNTFNSTAFSFLETWDCPHCSEAAWVFCKTQDNILQEITSTKLSASFLEQTDLVTILITQIFPIGYLRNRDMNIEIALHKNKGEVYRFFRNYLNHERA